MIGELILRVLPDFYNNQYNREFVRVVYKYKDKEKEIASCLPVDEANLLCLEIEAFLKFYQELHSPKQTYTVSFPRIASQKVQAIDPKHAVEIALKAVGKLECDVFSIPEENVTIPINMQSV